MASQSGLALPSEFEECMGYYLELFSYKQRNGNYVQHNTCTSMFIVVLFLIVQLKTIQLPANKYR